MVIKCANWVHSKLPLKSPKINFRPSSFPYKNHNLRRSHTIFFPLYSFKRQLFKSTINSPVAFLIRPKNPKNPSVPPQKPYIPPQLPKINSEPPNHIYIIDPYQILFQLTPKNPKSVTKNFSPPETLTYQPPYLLMQATSPCKNMHQRNDILFYLN